MLLNIEFISRRYNLLSELSISSESLFEKSNDFIFQVMHLTVFSKLSAFNAFWVRFYSTF